VRVEAAEEERGGEERERERKGRGEERERERERKGRGEERERSCMKRCEIARQYRSDYPAYRSVVLCR